MTSTADGTQLRGLSTPELTHGATTGLFGAPEVVRSCLERMDGRRFDERRPLKAAEGVEARACTYSLIDGR